MKNSVLLLTLLVSGCTAPDPTPGGTGPAPVSTLPTCLEGAVCSCVAPRVLSTHGLCALECATTVECQVESGAHCADGLCVVSCVSDRDCRAAGQTGTVCGPAVGPLGTPGTVCRAPERTPE